MPDETSETTPEPPRWRAALRVLQIVASIALLAWVVSRVDADSVRDLLRRIDPLEWTLGMALVLGAPLIAAERTRTLLLAAGADVPWRRVLAINLEATYFSVVLPGDLVGGVVRWARVRKKMASGGGALALLVVERLVDMMVLGACAIAGSAWLFEGEAARTGRWITAGAGLAIVLAAGSFLIGARSAAAKRLCHAAAARFSSGLRREDRPGRRVDPGRCRCGPGGADAPRGASCCSRPRSGRWRGRAPSRSPAPCTRSCRRSRTWELRRRSRSCPNSR